VELFEKAPAVRERYARQFQFVMVDEYQDTNRPQYLLIQALTPATATCAWWATPTSRSTSGAARTCGTSSTSSGTFRKRRS
jgi:DNA helicase-2/ATP-dependent DNA helicase PcrA